VPFRCWWLETRAATRPRQLAATHSVANPNGSVPPGREAIAIRARLARTARMRGRDQSVLVTAQFSRSCPQPQGRRVTGDGRPLWARGSRGRATLLGSGAGWDEGVDGEQQGAVGFDCGDCRLVGSCAAVGDEDLFADDRRAVFLPAAGGHGCSSVTYRGEGQIGDDVRRVPHPAHGICLVWSLVVLRGSKARRTALKRSSRLARSWLRCALARAA